MSDFTKTLIVDGDGGGDYTTIQAAVNALAATGGVVIVEQDTYTISSTISIPSNVTLIGRGNVILSVTSNVPVIKNSNYSSGTNKRITISGFKIVLNQASYACNVFGFKRVSHCILEKLQIQSLNSVTATFSAIDFEGSSSDPCEGNVITDCIIDTFGTVSNCGNGISLNAYCTGTMVVNNRLKACNNGIVLDSATTSVVSNNIISNCEANGIDGDDCDYSSFVGNESRENSNRGFSIVNAESCSFQGNICKSNIGVGIYLRGESGNESKYNSFVGNICYENGPGVGNSKDGIFLSSYSKYNVLDGNNLYGNSNYGIREYTSNVDYNLMVGNVVHGNTTGDIFVSGANSQTAHNMI